MSLRGAQSTFWRVAVVDAYNDPTATSDLAFYRSSWSEPARIASTGAGCLTILNENGASSPLPANSGSTGWSVEESLDVDMVSAICPNCHIYLFEANTPNFSDLGTAENSAVSLGIKFISNSYGGTDSSSDSTLDADYYNHPGVAITASAGDDGYFGSGVEYPASSRDVVAVGGTTLKTASNARGWKESVWATAQAKTGQDPAARSTRRSRPGRRARSTPAVRSGPTTKSQRMPTPTPARPCTTRTTTADGWKSAERARPRRSSPRPSPWGVPPR